MNRTTRLKLLYLIALLALGSATFATVATLYKRGEVIAVALVVLLLVVPGRVQGFFFRDLFKGRRLLQMNRPREALTHLHAFATHVRQRRRQKRLIWLAGSIYTTDVEAMTWNNIGVACANLRSWDEAKAAAAEALRLDEEYPLPHMVLAQISLVEGDRKAAEHHLRRATALGYRATSLDQLVHNMQGLLAKVEGQGGGNGGL